ncbi:MAG: DUF2917 domain-containing protein [Ramlibacter sp.]
MNRNQLPADLRLARRALLTIDDAAGVDLACHEGSLWITLDHDTRDIVVEAGGRFTTQEHRRAVIYAMEPSRLTLVAGPDGVPASQPGRRAAATLRLSHA